MSIGRSGATEELTNSRLDFLQFQGERLLRVCVVLSENNHILLQQLPLIQSTVSQLSEAISQLLSQQNSGYEPGHFTFTGRGRPRINVTEEMLTFLLGYGFSATRIALMLHTSLSTIRRRMAMYGLSVRSLYSDISNVDLDALVRHVQHHHAECGYRLMMGHLRSLGYRVQENRVRSSMMRTDPEGTISRWITRIQRRSYSVACPNSLWHIDGNHRLIR